MKLHIVLASILAITLTPLFADDKPAGVWEKRRSFLRGRIFHSAVWTYAEMIVWGGGANHEFYNDGGIYDPHEDRWRKVSLTNAPSGRWGHAAVWTGTEMIVWGGRSAFAAASNKNDGAIYNPATDTWRTMSTEGAPNARSQMAAVWTGQELLVWGGFGDGGTCFMTGGSYDPRTDSWTAMSEENAPEGRLEPAFVWTGREMIVWSGSHLDGETLVNVGMKTGGRYNPSADSWTPTTVNGAPDGRLYYGAAWTGAEMIVWGGGDQKSGNLSSGGRYDPAKDTWVATPEAGAPTGRSILTAVWTGDGMLTFGGSTGGVEAFNDLYYFRPNAEREK